MTVNPRRNKKKSRGRKGSASQSRADIQGLRALAVLFVVLDHLLKWPKGGFVGVDVFFVISGFLITGLLVRDLERFGRISFARFYRRRIRRILPISTLVLVVTVAASLLLFVTSKTGTVAQDALWALVFAANWRFAVQGTDYWAATSTPSPLQHYWSLAVEEQFYLVWPWLIILTFALVARSTRLQAHRSRVLLTVMLLVSVASFGWALQESVSNPSWAYFSTVSRAWELGVGATLAVATSSLARLPHGLRAPMTWLGLGGVVASLFLVTPASTFPAPWAALPVLSTALVIGAGTGDGRRVIPVLTSRPMTYLGDISYSLYLWHFPVVILMAVVLPPSMSWMYHVAAGILMLGLSVCSYHVLEDPIRHSTWLEPKRVSASEPGPRRRHRHRTRARRTSATRAREAGLVALAASVTVVLVLLTTQHGVNDAPAAGRSVTSTTNDRAAARAQPLEPLAAARQKEVQGALTVKTFPSLQPSVDTLDTGKWLSEVVPDGCLDVDEGQQDHCDFGDGHAGKDVAVLGDSYALAWMPAIRKLFGPLGWRVHSLTMQQCPSISVSVTKSVHRTDDVAQGAPYPECDRHREWALAEIGRLRPDLVILADTDATAVRLADAAGAAKPYEAVAKGAAATLAAITRSTSRTVVLSPPPRGKNLQECVTSVSSPMDCMSSIPDSWWSFSKTLEKAARTARAEYVDTHLWFCNRSGGCPGFVGTTPVRIDGAHLTTQYSEGLAPLLGESIFGRRATS